MIKLDPENLPENFCSVPWLQIHTEPDGSVMPCCYYSLEQKHKLGNWNDSNAIDIFHGDKWNSLRKSFLNNERPHACTRCWAEENSGSTSMRQRFNERYSNFQDYTNQKYYNKIIDIVNESNEDGTVNDIKLATIDLIFNNLCNLKCRTCGPGLSTSWIPDIIKLKRPTDGMTLLTNEHVTHLKDDLIKMAEMIDPYTEIHFSGGEPMMQEDHYQFLQLLIDMGKTNVKIRYNTNLTTYTLKHYDAFELLSKFEDVFIVGSVDAMGSEGEYIRKGFDWKKSLEWIKVAKERLPKGSFAISAVYSLLNCLSAVDLHRYMCDNDLFKTNDPNLGEKNFGFYLNTLHGPPYLRTTVLPKELKEEVETKIKNHMEWLEKTQPKDFSYDSYMSHWQNAINFMNSSDGSFMIKNFYKETHELDSVRDEKFEEVFPYLHSILGKYVS